MHRFRLGRRRVERHRNGFLDEAVVLRRADGGARARARPKSPREHRRKLARVLAPRVFFAHARGVQSAVHQKAAQNARRRPRNAVGPALDARALFNEHENVAQANEQVPFAVERPARDGGDFFIERRLDHKQRIFGGADKAYVGRSERRHGRAKTNKYLQISGQDGALKDARSVSGWGSETATIAIGVVGVVLPTAHLQASLSGR
ncbi:hypothetical protein CLUG_00579 [Clavispora lusitaniae ATCC 42720]|uniref:Uncharacterized protein n=1 Tax=Clavispora lusitaniae (strain ATCC 42720) TaxID=306902 RepID=C4XXA6_CLAL4|nr:uncharacterized protein CLUG_00579 [Clavispora lusitaniae ATCC 42720]EEQ36455.1 hypothetical protein CLUG_00579 [Clavispora lusitaniae ATCC 42720]